MLILSKILSNASASQPSVHLDPLEISKPEISLLAAGLCVLAVWIFRKKGNPKVLLMKGTPGRPNKITPLHIIAIFLFYILLGLLLPIFFNDSIHARILMGVIAQVVLLAAVLVVAYMTFPLGLSRGMGLSLRHPIYDTARAIVGYLAVYPLCMAMLIVSVLLIPEKIQKINPALENFTNLLDKGETFWVFMIIVSAVILAPLYEEIFFRGVLQTMLRKYFQSPLIAVIVTSVFFALMHYPMIQDLPALFVLSFVLGYNYEKSGRLYSSILIHAIFNAVSISLLFWKICYAG